MRWVFMKKLICQVTFLVLVGVISGCSAPKIDLTDGGVSNKPNRLPLISWIYRGRSRNYSVQVESINGKSVGWADVAFVDPGDYTIVYSCRNYKRKINKSGSIDITVEPGHMYYLKPLPQTQRITRTKPIRLQTYLVRDKNGRLRDKYEPVYQDFSYTRTVGCYVQPIVCEGYLYFSESGSRSACFSEPLGFKNLLPQYHDIGPAFEWHAE